MFLVLGVDDLVESVKLFARPAGGWVPIRLVTPTRMDARVTCSKLQVSMNLGENELANCGIRPPLDPTLERGLGRCKGGNIGVLTNLGG